MGLIASIGKKKSYPHPMFDSNGCMRTIVHFLTENETTSLQILNHRFYDWVIPRAQIRIHKQKQPICIFTLLGSLKNWRSIIKWESDDQRITISRNTIIDLYSIHTVQVKDDLYAL